MEQPKSATIPAHTFNPSHFPPRTQYLKKRFSNVEGLERNQNAMIEIPAIPTQRRLPKFERRPDLMPHREITERSFQIIELLHRYRFLPASLLRVLIQGDSRTTDRQLQALWQKDLVSRFVFPKVGTPGEFHYFLENSDALRLLADHGRVNADDLDLETVRLHRDRRYADIHTSAAHQGQALFLRHEVMISRFHAMLQLGCRATDGQVVLRQWVQGPALWATIEIPRITFSETEQLWFEPGDTERTPHRPDAFFTLQFPALAPKDQHQHFFYEADRGTESTKRFIRKLRAHFHFIAVQKRHREDYKAHRIRAVLVETERSEWADTLCKSASHPLVSGRKTSPLFWFTHAGQFNQPVQHDIGKRASRVITVPQFIKDPLVIFQRVWKPATGTNPLSLLDF